MDPVLSTAYPVNKIGSDGFSWWVGQIESGKNDDPKNSGRYRVRIVGLHLKDCNAVPTESLPWANVMMPVTVPFTDGGSTGASVGLDIGNWVIGFYLDNDKQKPMIMGSIGHTAGATLLENVENDPNPASTCKSFTTFIKESNPYVHAPIDSGEVRDKEEDPEENSNTTKVGQAGKIAAAVPGKMPRAFYALFQEATETNPTGKKICVEIANPNCGSEKNLESNLKNIIADMLKANQSSGGNIGSYYVSKFNGELTNYISTGRTYINKAIRLVKSFIARLKGEIVKLLKGAVDKLVEALLYVDVASKDALGNVNTGPVNPDLGVKPFSPITKKESRLKEVIETINNVLNEVGCSMEDLTTKIADYITDLLFGFLMDAYRGAACLVDTLVSGIINQLIEFIESSLASILGPLQELLGTLARPANLIGNIVAKAFDLLGISCDGPSAQCEKIEKVCVDGESNETIDDWLDDLLDKIEDGPLDTTSYVCDEAKQNPTVSPTTIQFVGGIFEIPPSQVSSPTGGSPTGGTGSTSTPTTTLIQYTSEDIEVTEGQLATFTINRLGNVSVASSIKVKIYPKTAKLNEDFQKDFDGSVLGFAPYETSKRISFRTFADRDFTEVSEFFFIRIESRVLPEGFSVNFPNGRDFRCTINDGFNSIPTIPPGQGDDPYIPPSSTQVPDIILTEPIPSPLPTARFSVEAERPFYLEGQSVFFNINSVNVLPGTLIEGTVDVDPEDIVGGETTYTFTVDENGQGRVGFVLAVNNDNFRVDPPGTIALRDEQGELILDEEGNVQYNTEEIITEFDDLNEVLTFTITSTGDSGFTTILGENDEEPVYFVTADDTSYSEGDTITYSITTYNVPDGTLLSYTLSGNGITREDFVKKSLVGSFEVVNGEAEVQVTLAIDDVVDPGRILTFSIDNTDAEAVVSILSDEVVVEEEVIPTFSVTTDKLEYKEGEVIEYTITTTDVPDGSVFQWFLTGGGVTPDDFVGGKLSDILVIINNTAKVYVSISEDAEIETSETVNFFLSGTNGFASVVIVEDDLDEDGSDDVTPIIEEKPCLDKPIAGEPITDATGSIISIPIISQGCPYVEPPLVVIGGAGTGASAIPLLDDTGRVSEIRVTRVGGGYKKNTASDLNLTCVIDSFTMLNLGRGYTSAPSVFVDGKPNIAKAIIDERGFVVSVQILDRSLQINDIPIVTFSGGGGSGARALASVVCLDTIDELAASGYAKIGTGKYIDCP